MKIAELEEQLSNYPPDLDVVIEVDGESRLIEIAEVSQIPGTDAVLLTPVCYYYKPSK